MKTLILTCLLGSNLAFANNTDYTQLSKSIASLRAKVEAVDSEIKNLRITEGEELRSLSIQKAELESSINGEEVKAKQFQAQMNQFKEKIEKSSLGDTDYKSTLESLLPRVEKLISQGIPFKRKERLEFLAGIKSRYERKELSPGLALVRLWGVLQDEERFNRENQILKQTINIDGKQYLAETIKFGAMGMIYYIDENHAGYAEIVNGTWTFKSYKAKEIEIVEKVLDGFKKKIFVGSYLMPPYVFQGEVL